MCHLEYLNHSFISPQFLNSAHFSQWTSSLFVCYKKQQIDALNWHWCFRYCCFCRCQAETLLKCVDCRAKKLPVLPLCEWVFVCVFCVFYVLIFIIYIHKDTANTQTHTHSNAGSVSWSQIHLSCLLLCAGELFPMSSWFSLHPPPSSTCLHHSVTLLVVRLSLSCGCRCHLQMCLPLLLL